MRVPPPSDDDDGKTKQKEEQYELFSPLVPFPAISTLGPIGRST
jgi:hypothetical protein